MTAPSSKTGAIRIGIGGWTYEPWRGTFYPADLVQKRELEFASRRLTSIEVNGTFYRSQKPETFAKWHDETPDGFVFALKAPRYATVRRVLAEAGDSIERFVASGIVELKDKLGPINWQFAPTKVFDPGDFEAFLKLLPGSHEGRVLRHAVEVRHASFCCAEFVALARGYGVAVVVSGDSAHPLIGDVTADFVYARVMGTSEDEALGYSGGALDVWAERARHWARGERAPGLATFGDAAVVGARDVYLYVISGFKARNPQAAAALMGRV